MSEYYGYDNRNSWWHAFPPVTRNIILINLIMFAATLFKQDFMTGTFALFYPASHFFRLWQPITHMFMHGGFWHIFFNMYALFIFGTVLERTIGTRRFLIFYFVTGLGAALLHTGVGFIKAQQLLGSVNAGDPTALIAYSNLLRTPTLGASGAVYGVLIGYAMFYPNSVLTLIFPPIPLKAKWWVLIFIVIELVTGITGTMDGIAHFAHLGGALFGFLLILYWRKTGRLYRY